MADTYNLIGVQKVEIGTVQSDGSMPTSMTEYSGIKEGTCDLNIEAPSSSYVNVEDSDTPYLSVFDGAEVKEIGMTLLGVDADGLVVFKGGSASGGAWSAPTVASTIEKALKITTRDDSGKHWTIKIPRAKVKASIAGNLTKSDVIGLDITFEVLTPSDGSGGFATPVVMAWEAGDTYGATVEGLSEDTLEVDVTSDSISGVTLKLEQNTDDTLDVQYNVVSGAADELVIKLADTTDTKNTVALIETAIIALGIVQGVDFSTAECTGTGWDEGGQTGDTITTASDTFASS